MQAVMKTTEAAAKSLVKTLPITASVFTGIDNETKLAPCVIIQAESATEEFPFSGLFFVKTKIRIKEMAADTDTDSGLSKTVFDAFMDSNIATNLAAQTSSYSVASVWVDNAENSIEGDACVQDMTFNVVCGL